MSNLRRQARRTLPVVILDATLALGAALATGHPPWSRSGRPAEPDEPDGPDQSGERAGAGRAGRGRLSRRSAAIWITVAAVAAAGGTVLLVAAFLKSPGGLAPLGVASPPPAAVMPPGPSAAPGPTATPAAGFGSPAPAPSGAGPRTPTPGGTTTAPAPGSPGPLTARYETANGAAGLLGYRASVTIANPGTAEAPGWVLTVELPRSSLRIGDVDGATARQDGRVWTFTPDPTTAKVPAGGTVSVTFEVRGATLVSAAPTSCAIDGRPCEGVAD